MSYLFTVLGPPVELRDICSMELLPVTAAEAGLVGQSVLVDAMAGLPLFLVHDGVTNTSHDLVTEAENTAIDGGSLLQTQLVKVVRQVLSIDLAFRISWEGNQVTSPPVIPCFTSEKALETLLLQLDRGPFVGIEYLPQRYQGVVPNTGAR